MSDLESDNPSSDPALATCDSCGCSKYTDTPIPGGRVRRDCAKCNRFMGWAAWYGDQLENSTTADMPNTVTTTAAGTTNEDPTMNKNVILITTTTAPAVSASLVDQINAEHTRASLLRITLWITRWLAATSLAQAKVEAGHGHWEDWLGEKLPWLRRRQQEPTCGWPRAVSCSRQNVSTLTVLSLREAYRLIARPETDLDDSSTTGENGVADVVSGRSGWR